MAPRNIDSFDEPKIDAHLSRALGRLVEFDSLLFKHNASERSICHRLALYLQDEFPDFDVDCEYNRHWRETDLCKQLRSEELLRIAGHPKIEDDDSITVFPDIVVHRRDTDDNLLVIEAKKTTSGIPEAYDQQKLLAYQHELKYCFAKFLKFGTRQNDKFIAYNEFVKPKTA